MKNIAILLVLALSFTFCGIIPEEGFIPKEKEEDKFIPVLLEEIREVPVREPVEVPNEQAEEVREVNLMPNLAGRWVKHECNIHRNHYVKFKMRDDGTNTAEYHSYFDNSFVHNRNCRNFTQSVETVEYHIYNEEWSDETTPNTYPYKFCFWPIHRPKEKTCTGFDHSEDWRAITMYPHAMAKIPGAFHVLR